MCGSVDLRSYEYLKFVTPCVGFKDFKALENLWVDSQCLFGLRDPQWSHITPPPPQLLPTTLKSLTLFFPRIEIYDWLARIPHFRNELPVLTKVEVDCLGEYGDSYEILAYVSYPHPVLAAMKSIGVELYVSYTYEDWNDAC